MREVGRKVGKELAGEGPRANKTKGFCVGWRRKFYLCRPPCN